MSSSQAASWGSLQPLSHPSIPALFYTPTPAAHFLAPSVLTLAGAFSEVVAAVLAENVLVLFKEILCFIKDILDLLQQLEGRLAEISDTGLEGERGPPW